jgi:hypothetical protein
MSDRDDVKGAIEAFIDVVESITLPPEKRLKLLPRALDSLAVVATGITVEFDEANYPDEPREDHRVTYEVMQRQRCTRATVGFNAALALECL